MKNCDNCKYDAWDYVGHKPCENCVSKGNEPPSFWEALENYIPMTNADRIRAMSAEELAGLLLNGCTGGNCHERPQNEWGSVDCFKCRMEWLQQPAEVDNG